MTRAAAVVAGLVAIVSCGGTQRPGVGGAGGRPATPAEVLAIQKVVFDAQRGGFIRHDLETYMSQWSDDARVVAARQEQPGAYEYALDRGQIEATRRMRFHGDSAVMTIEYEDPRVTVAGDTATLSVRTRMSYRDGSESVGEVYRLRLTADGWRVFENRYWPVSQTSGGETITIDAAYYAAADARVDAERDAGDPYELAVALMRANRYPEAVASLRELTDAGDAEAYDWVLRGLAAVAVGDAEDASAAFAAGLALDPTVPVPAYAR